MANYGTKSGTIAPGDINTAQRLVSGMVSTIDVDEAGDVVIPSGVKTKRYFDTFKSVNLDHDITKPIGSHRSMSVKSNGIRVSFYVSKSMLGQDVWTMLNEGVMRGLSIHWDSRDHVAGPPTQDERKRYGEKARRVIREWEMMSYAVTAMPMNAHTVIDEIKGIDRLVRLGKVRQESARAAGWTPDGPAPTTRMILIPGVGCLHVPAA